MPQSPIRTWTETGSIAWYFSSKLRSPQALDLLELTGSAVLRGRSGHKLGAQLRAAGYSGSLWLDPAAYDSAKENPADVTLFGDRRLAFQRELGVVEVISPGRFVDQLDSIEKALELEASWLQEAGGGRLSLALDTRWLTVGLDRLIESLATVGLPLALALESGRDPLALAGAVQGLVDLIDEVGQVAILRCDVGAIGAMVHGAELGAIGTTGTVRHVVRSGSGGGGSPEAPSVFVTELLDFKLGSYLDELPQEANPVCELECCNGRPLRRFNGRHMAEDAIGHNCRALASVIAEISDVDPQDRPAAFAAMCGEAIQALHELSIRARRPMSVRRQLQAWANLA